LKTVSKLESKIEFPNPHHGVAAGLLSHSRWAGGARRKDGIRFHPGLGIALLMILLTIGGPMLPSGIAARIFSGG
jgi:hypothetical protein